MKKNFIFLAVFGIFLFSISNISFAETDVSTGLPVNNISPTKPIASMLSQSSGVNILWDTYHGITNNYTPSGRFSYLRSILDNRGYIVNENTSGVLNLDLSNFDILVICLGSAWSSNYSATEVIAIENFVNNGGGLLILAENTNCPNRNINPVSEEFGTTLGLSSFSPSDLYITNLTSHPIFNGISQIYMRAAGEISGAFPSSDQAWAVTGGAIATVAELFPGRVITLGDTNIFDNFYIDNVDNQIFAENVFDWLHGDSNAFSDLSIVIDPQDGGMVSGPGILCGNGNSDCEESYEPGTEITLIAEPNTGWEFEYWDDGIACYLDTDFRFIADIDRIITAKFKKTPVLDSISGYSDGVGVSKGKWTGQPSKAPKRASNQYVDYYVIESQNNSYYWLIRGAGFGDSGEILFSNSDISVANIVKWTDTEIKFVPTVPHNFTYDSNMTMTITNNYGFLGEINIPVIGIIKSRGYGQCTWYVAKTLLDQGKAIPSRAYLKNEKINENYVPMQWDALSFGKHHVATIISEVTKTEEVLKKSTLIKYSFTVGEMNAQWDEVPSSYLGEFIVEIKNEDSKKIKSNKMSGMNKKGAAATGCFRTE